MSTEPTAPWRPDTDPDYGQVLVRHLLYSYRWTLVAGVILGAAAALIVSVFIPPSYSANATVVVEGGSSNMGGLMGGLALLGGGNSALENEIQVIESREIARSVIGELGLHVEVVDWKSPDMSINRLLSKLALGPKLKGSREEIHSRLQIRDVSVNPDMLNDYKLDLAYDGSGWKTGSKSGADGEPVVFDAFSFTPVFGSAAQAGDSFRLVIRPDWDTFQDFQNRLVANAISETANVITISYRHRNPFICREVVGRVAEDYLARYEQQEIGDYDVILDYVDDEITSTQLRVEDIVAELGEYRENNKIYEPTAQATSAIQTMAQLSILQGQNDIQVRQIEHLLDNMDRRTPNEINQSIQSPVNPLPIDQALTERLAALITSLDGLQQTHTDAHPEVIRVRSSIDVVLGQIQDSLEASAMQLNLANRNLTADISSQRSELTALPAAESKIALLTSELQVNSEILGMLKKSEAETRLLREESTTDVSLLDSPIVPIKPGSPRLGKNVFLGILAGLVIAILVGLALESGSQNISSLREIRSGLGLPVLGVLPGNPLKGPWQPGDTAESNAVESISRRLGADKGATALIHVCNAAGGYNLAWDLSRHLARSGKVLLVDVDSADRSFSTAIGKSSTSRITDMAESRTIPAGGCTEIDDARWLLGPGSPAMNAEQSAAVVSTLKSNFNSVLVCMGNPASWANTEDFARSLDRAVLVLPQTGCSRQLVASALQSLSSHGIKPVGAIVTEYSVSRDAMGKRELQMSGLEV